MDIILDIETTTWFDDPRIRSLPRSQQVDAMEFGLAVTFDAAQRWRIWLAGQEAELWTALHVPGARVIGWNSNAFDLPVVRNHAHRYDPDAVDVWPNTLDPFDAIRAATGRWYSLEAVAQANLGRGKSGHGKTAALDIRSGDPARIARAAFYCRDDVELTLGLVSRLFAGEMLSLPPRIEKDETDELFAAYSDDDGWTVQPAEDFLIDAPPIGS